MSEQANHEAILSKTLRILVQQHQLTSAELAQIRLADLHLAGKSPTISFTPTGGLEPKVVQLDLDTHRALVNWLVNRPDAVSDFLFPGSGAEAMSEADLQRLLEQAGTAPVAAESTTLPFPPAPPEVAEGLPPMPPSASRPLRPVSRPEMGAPPPGASHLPFQPPPVPPEVDEGASPPAPKPAPSTAKPINPSRPVAVPPAPPEAQPVPLPETKQATPAAEAAADATLASAKKPETPEPPKSQTKAEPPAAKPTAAASTPVAKTPAPRQASRPVQPAMAAKAAKPPSFSQRPVWARFALPGIVVAALLLCGICLASGWFAGQGGPMGELLASLGLSSSPTEEAQTGTVEATTESSVFESVPATPTLPPTSTSTPLPPTNTPAPTDTSTPTPAPTDTPTVLPTDTPEPTATPTPTETPEPTAEPEEASPTKEPAAPSTTYPAPELLDPATDFSFIQGNTIVLKWKPVDLAPNEHYAVRLVYKYQGQPTYQGSNVKESEWTIPLALFGQIDPPENRYEWFVQIERVNDDGTGTAISPESEHRFFTWK